MTRELEIEGNSVIVIEGAGRITTYRAQQEKIGIKDAFRLAGMSFSSVKIYATARIESEAMSYLLSMCREPTRPYNQEQ